MFENGLDQGQGMKDETKIQLHGLRLGDAQIYKNIVPLLAPKKATFQYGKLGEALATSGLAITEVSAQGSVPELLVVNRARIPALLLDGEELAGAKQEAEKRALKRAGKICNRGATNGKRNRRPAAGASGVRVRRCG